jgi:hypothetical protein
MADTELLTVKEIAAERKVPWRRVAYAAAEYGIEPTRRAGTTKLFARSQLPQIMNAVRRVTARAKGGL